MCTWCRRCGPGRLEELMFFDVSMNVAATIFRVSESGRYREKLRHTVSMLNVGGESPAGRGSSMLPFLRDP